MTQAILEHVNAELVKKRVPVLRPGYAVKVFQKIKEGDKERTQIFEGLIIKMSAGSGVNRTFTVRKIVDGIGVEKTFPLYAPSLEKIEIVKSGKVRRAKLYFMRDRSGKSTRLKDMLLGDVATTGEDAKEVEPEVEEEPAVEEEVVAEETSEAETAEAVEETPVEEAAPEEEAVAEEAPAENEEKN